MAKEFNKNNLVFLREMRRNLLPNEVRIVLDSIGEDTKEISLDDHAMNVIDALTESIAKAFAEAINQIIGVEICKVDIHQYCMLGDVLRQAFNYCFDKENDTKADLLSDWLSLIIDRGDPLNVENLIKLYENNINPIFRMVFVCYGFNFLSTEGHLEFNEAYDGCVLDLNNSNKLIQLQNVWFTIEHLTNCFEYENLRRKLVKNQDFPGSELLNSVATACMNYNSEIYLQAKKLFETAFIAWQFIRVAHNNEVPEQVRLPFEGNYESLPKTISDTIPRVDNLLKSHFDAYQHPATAMLLQTFKKYTHNLRLTNQTEFAERIEKSLDDLTTTFSEPTIKALLREQLFSHCLDNLYPLIVDQIYDLQEELKNYTNHIENNLLVFKKINMTPVEVVSKLFMGNQTSILVLKQNKQNYVYEEVDLIGLLKQWKPQSDDKIVLAQYLADYKKAKLIIEKFTNISFLKIMNKSDDPICKMFLEQLKLLFNYNHVFNYDNFRALNVDKFGEKVEFFVRLGKHITDVYLEKNKNKKIKIDLKKSDKYLSLVTAYQLRKLDIITEFINGFPENTKKAKEKNLTVDTGNNDSQIIQSLINTDLSEKKAKNTTNDTSFPLIYPSTYAIMLVMKQYAPRLSQKEQRYHQSNNCMNNVNKLIKQHKNNQTISREQLFADVLGHIYPIAAINTGLHFRSTTTGEKLLWRQLLPEMNTQEKALLHAHMTLARLRQEYNPKSKSQFNNNTKEKIDAIVKSIEALAKASGNTEVSAAIAQLEGAYTQKRKRLFSGCVPNKRETSSTKSFRKNR